MALAILVEEDVVDGAGNVIIADESIELDSVDGVVAITDGEFEAQLVKSSLSEVM